jgi:hypothetical protein
MSLLTSRRALLAAVALGASALPFVADVGVAEAAVTTGFAFVKADQPFTTSYTPSTNHQANSLGGTNTVVRNGTGNYTVTFPGFAGQGNEGGNPQVSSSGSNSTAKCKVGSWGSSWLAMTVNIRCHGTNGAAIDSEFNLQYQANTGTATFDQGYVWANQPFSSSYNPPTPRSWNSKGGTNTITRSGLGRYMVTFPNLVVSGGNVQVTAYGTNSDYCNVTGWGGTVVQVACFNRFGLATDSQFTASYTTLRMPSAQWRTKGFYMWMDQETNTSWHAPASPWRFSTHSTVDARKEAAGEYQVAIFGFPPSNDTLPVVTAYNTNRFCRITAWQPWIDGALVVVRCFTPSGTPADAKFSLLYNTNHLF